MMENDRIASIDIVRGIAMIIMPLDHVRDLIHDSSIFQSPTDLATASPILFLTRWITHICAPIFVFLAGTSVCRMQIKRNDYLSTRKFLFKRGLFLIALEFVVVNTLIYFDLGFHNLLFEVIAAIGFGFIILSLMLNLKLTTVLIFGLVIIFFNNALSAFPDSILKTVLSPLFAVSQYPLPGNRILTIAYPPIPWLGIMLLGYAAGKCYDFAQAKTANIFFWMGCLALLLFGGLRLINFYGDPLPWSVQRNGTYTVLSFLNVTKYPPSLLFTLVTLGLMCLMLAKAEKFNPIIGRTLSVYGKVPLFYFLLHFFLIHILLLVILLLQGFPWSAFNFASGTFGRPANVVSGLPLPYIFIIWIGIVAILYKPCIWFAAYKRQSNLGWIKYL